jgi:flagellar L-ring protein precursor FlgH
MSKAIGMIAVLAACGAATGQVLFELPQPAAAGPGRPGELPVATDGAPSLSEVSLFAVRPPEPRAFAENDLVTIIISERSKTDRKHDFDTEKSASLGGNVESTIDLLKLLELRLQQGRDSDDDLPVWDVSLDKDFEGKSQFKRDDTVTARVTARVVEVKPNGTLLVEARTTVTTDYEEEVITLAGVCRTEDITDANTVQSNQMFDLRLAIQHMGEVRKGSEKGVVTRVMDVIFNY